MIIFNAGGHLLFGFAAAVALHVFGVVFSAYTLVTLLVGSLLPDLDHPRSTLGRWNPFARLRLTKHRGHYHSLIGSFLLSTPFYLFEGVRGLLFAFVGAVGHLCADKLYSWFPNKKPFHIRIW